MSEALEVALCRLCLCRAAPTLHPLFARRRHYIRYTLALAFVTGLQIEVNDGLPQYICTNCTDIVNSCLHFRTKCHKTEIQLLQGGFRRKTQRCREIKKISTESSKKDWTDREFLECDFMSKELKSYNTKSLSLKSELPIFKMEKLSDENFSDNCDSDKEIEKECFMQSPKQESIEDVDNFKSDKPNSVNYDKDIIVSENIYPKFKVNKKKGGRGDTNAMIEKALKYYQSKLKFKRQKVRHLSVGPVESKGPYQCKLCKKIFTRWTNFYWHTKIHTGFDYVCEHCGKKCINNNVLLRHLRSRHGLERELCCQHCDFRGLDKMQMTLHVRARHTGERPFICDVCGASFTGKRLLIQHLPKHSDNRPVQCDACPSKFKTKHDLVVHKSKVHRPREWRYECYICNNSFTRAQNARAHIKKFHCIAVKEQEELRKIRLE